MSALDFYVVEELFVADCGRPGGLDATAWEQIANERKVALVHRVPSNTVAEKAFCKGVGVGVFLSRRLEEGHESPLSATSPQSFPHRDASFGIPQRSDTCQMDFPRRSPCANAAEAIELPSWSELALGQDMTAQSSCDLLLHWLRHALSQALPEDDACCFLVGAQAILDGVEEAGESVDEALCNVCAILDDCAPDVARELPLRWHAIQHADADLDPVAVVLLPAQALPALCSVIAQETLGGESAEAIGQHAAKVTLKPILSHTVIQH